MCTSKSSDLTLLPFLKGNRDGDKKYKHVIVFVGGGGGGRRRKRRGRRRRRRASMVVW
jgi:hypothetical protein